MESDLIIDALARNLPVWIADTPAHAALKNSSRINSKFPPMTWFPLKGGETLEDAAVRISYSLDDHYNGIAQKDCYKFLLVFGAKYLTSMEASFRELEFNKFEPTRFGFVVGK